MNISVFLRGMDSEIDESKQNNRRYSCGMISQTQIANNCTAIYKVGGCTSNEV